MNYKIIETLLRNKGVFTLKMFYKEVTWTDFDLLERFMTDVFVELNVPRDDAEICANVLITADKLGIDSHGIGRFYPIYVERLKARVQEPITNFEIIRESPTTAVVDGNHGMGHVIGFKSMDLAMKKAKDYGMGMIAVRNSTHYGIAGYYSLMAVKENMIGITGTNARPAIAPTFGTEPMLGTNPLSIGIPSDDDFPFIFDAATSVTQRGKIEVFARAEKEIPQGWVIGEDGEVRTDTASILIDLEKGKAALLPLGGKGSETAGYKGYGFATVVELLSAALQDGSYLKALSGYDSNGNRTPYKVGHFFVAINIEAFTEIDKFKRTAGEILRELRRSRKDPNAERIYTAGEKEYLTWKERKNKGAPIDKVIKSQLIELRDEFNLKSYIFPWEKDIYS